MVVDDVDDVDFGSVGEVGVGGVGLPQFVDELSNEPAPGLVWRLVRFRNDEPAPFQDPPDRRCCRSVAPGIVEVSLDRLGPRIEPVAVELLA